MKRIARTVGSELFSAACGGAWIAAREFDARPWRRRGVRAGVVAAIAAAELLRRHREPPAEKTPTTVRGLVLAPDTVTLEPTRHGPRDLPWRPLVAGAVVGAGTLYGWRQLENRWIARLAARGHARPAVAVGTRVALIQLAAVGALRLARRRRGD
ncbi:hypothetical protein Val02_01900 [Virgisporangium aliadipatigenens]|uniref:Uncharacterized protein n=1 Tax=Virgisporangium aliadipatigenens TaxID=741659 RepID=A0A8J3YDV5_9ACTN|nr:hypothetical protein [Virgisporangium aliadipatigenens]GIJ43304.1 hypothetical protein Val02_01900 [Virgisporangium aliadipatigenens]